MKKKNTEKKIITTENKMFSNSISMDKIIGINTQTSNEMFTKGLFVETVDVNKLAALLKSKDILKKYTHKDHKVEIIYYENEKNHLTTILHSLTRDNTSIISYSGGKDTEYGRVYSKRSLSLGTIRREIRHFLCKETYWDIDIVNCHPNLLVGICKSMGIHTHFLNEYVTKREKYLEKIMKDFDIDRDKAKKGICALINGGGIKNNFGEELDGGWLVNFKDECVRIAQSLKRKNPDLFNKITKNTASSKKIRRFMAIYLQMVEVEVMKEVFEYCCERGLTAQYWDSKIILCHDGVMLDKSHFKNDKAVNIFISGLNAQMENLFPDYNCVFKIKSMGVHYNEICEQLKKQKIDYDEKYVDSWTLKYGVSRAELPELESDDTSLSNLYFKQNDDRWVYTMGTLYKKNEVGIYKKSNAKGLMAVYRNYMKEMVDYKADPEDVGSQFLRQAEDLLHRSLLFNDADTKKKWKELNNYIQRGAKASSKCNDEIRKKLLSNKSLKDIVNLMESSFNDDKFDELLDSDDNLMGFENGVLNIPNKYTGNKDWYNIRPAKKGEYVNMSTGYEFYIDEEVLKAKEHLEKTMASMFETPDVRIFLLKSIAKTIRGHNNREEEAYFWKGEGSNGKGATLDFLKESFGDYFDTISYKILVFVSKDGDNRSTALYSARKKRFLSITEPNKKFQWQADLFKLLTGGDEISTRNNYAKKQTKFVPNALFIQANHNINMLGNTRQNCISRRIKAINFPYIFNDNPDTIKYEKKIDRSLKDVMKNDDYKRAFMLILLEHYDLYLKEKLIAPPKIVEYSKEYCQNLSADAEWFDDNLKPKNKKDGGFDIKLGMILDKFNMDNHKNWGMKYMKDKLEEFNYKIGKGNAKIYNCYEGWHDSTSNNDVIVKNVYPDWIDAATVKTEDEQ
jgi:hypothetical protein